MLAIAFEQQFVSLPRCHPSLIYQATVASRSTPLLILLPADHNVLHAVAVSFITFPSYPCHDQVRQLDVKGEICSMPPMRPETVMLLQSFDNPSGDFVSKKSWFGSLKHFATKTVPQSWRGILPPALESGDSGPQAVPARLLELAVIVVLRYATLKRIRLGTSVEDALGDAYIRYLMSDLPSKISQWLHGRRGLYLIAENSEELSEDTGEASKMTEELTDDKIRAFICSIPWSINGCDDEWSLGTHLQS
ncbi:hypothetical protein B0H13DRAFT_2527456 [Mycena leptocephala]|nr:hypothetical protein B0H13DRAFT_2527456 [Mycena leptocephala]